MTLTVNILTFELMRCFTEETETLCIISIKTFLPVSIIMRIVQFFCVLKYKVIKDYFLLVSFHLIVISIVRINALLCWYVFLAHGQYNGQSVLCFLC